MSDADNDSVVFEIPTSQKLFPAGFSILLLALAWLLMTSGGLMVYLGWGAIALAVFQAVQSAIFFAKSEVCRIEDGTLIVNVGPIGSTRVDLEDIIEIESEEPYLSIRAEDNDEEDDDTRLVQVATNVLATADRNRLTQLLRE